MVVFFHSGNCFHDWQEQQIFVPQVHYISFFGGGGGGKEGKETERIKNNEIK